AINELPSPVTLSAPRPALRRCLTNSAGRIRIDGCLEKTYILSAGRRMEGWRATSVFSFHILREKASGLSYIKPRRLASMTDFLSIFPKKLERQKPHAV
ncbi:MAG: hypothetical protein ACQERN_06720, partial [Thermodesulfobacteriota bacterium]